MPNPKNDESENETDAGESLIEDILSETVGQREDGGPREGAAKREAVESAAPRATPAMKAIIAEILAGPGEEGVKPDREAVDAAIARIDRQLGAQMDAILHHPELQRLEAAWRGLGLVIARADFRQGIQVEMLNCSKEDLLLDLALNADISESGLYQRVCRKEIGVPGDEPYAVIVANFEFEPNELDMKLLHVCGWVAGMANCPFIAGAAGTFFGSKDLTPLPRHKNVRGIFREPEYGDWRAFRESDDSRLVGLAVPRFLLRAPYGKESNRVNVFDYEERIDESREHYLWGNGSFAYAVRALDAYARNGWGGTITEAAVENLPLHQYGSGGQIITQPPVEIGMDEQLAIALDEEGFMPLVTRRGYDSVRFFAARPCHT